MKVKRMSTQEKTPKDQKLKHAGGRKAGAIYFPRNSLKKAIEIPTAIWNNHAGKPFDILDLAKCLDVAPKSSAFEILIASSLRYGLTTGSPATNVVSLTPLGSDIVAPTVGVDVKAKLREALLFSDIFRKVYSDLDKKPIPRQDIFRNTLIKPVESGGYGLLERDVDNFLKVFNQNIADYDLLQEQKGGASYLRLDQLSPITEPEKPEPEEGEEVGTGEPEPTPEVPTVPVPVVKKQIFIAHGKNKKPLEELKNILTSFKVPYQVAIDEPHKGRPISAKVAQLMKECSSGIFIFTADEETKDLEGKTVWRPSDNVVFELGAGTVLYGEKIVIFREEGVSFGSDFTELGHITFEKDKLDAKAFDLMKELISLEFLQLTPK